MAFLFDSWLAEGAVPEVIFPRFSFSVDLCWEPAVSLRMTLFPTALLSF